MKFTSKQFDHLADIMKEAGAIILGGIVIGRVFTSETPTFVVIAGTFAYIIFILISLYLIKRGEKND